MAVDKDAARIRRLFASISPRYDLLNHVLSLGIDRSWRRRTVRSLELAPSAQVLDVCTGTADLALELAGALDPEAGGRVLGTDFTPEMVALGEAKRRRQGDAGHVRLAVADTLRLPFEAGRFDAVTVAFGVRNVADLDAGLRELRRVLKPGGQLAILEFATPRHRAIRWVYQAYFHRVLPRLGAAVSRSRAGEEAYGYLPESVGQFPAPDALAERLRSIGFEDVRYRRMTGGIAALHLGRRAAAAAETALALPERVTLVVERRSPVGTPEIAAALVRALGVPAPDARARCRYGRGLLAEDLPEADAARLEAALAEIGVRAVRVRPEDWRAAIRGARFATIELVGDELVAGSAGGRRTRLPRERVHGIDLYAVVPGAENGSAREEELEEDRAARRRAAPVELSQLSARGRRLLENLIEAELEDLEIGLTIFGEPPVGPLRTSRSDLRFDTLGGDRLDHSLDNFLLILDRLVEFLPDVAGRERVTGFLERLDPTEIIYAKPEERQNAERWLHVQAVLGRAAREPPADHPPETHDAP